MNMPPMPWKLPNKSLSLYLEDAEQLCQVAKALSAPERLEILKYLSQSGHSIISQIAAHCHLPLSSTAYHLRMLEAADLILIGSIPGSRGSQKLCYLTTTAVSFFLFPADTEPEVELLSQQSMPIGNYFDYQAEPSCGLTSETTRLKPFDDSSAFCAPNRFRAQLIWMSKGYLEYRFSNKAFSDSKIKQVTFSLELCSEWPGVRDDWPSDISVWLNGHEIGLIHSPGNYGDRRGRLTPSWWGDDLSQYGDLWWISVTEDGCYINEKRVSDETPDTLGLNSGSFIRFRIGVKSDAEHCGGFNLFGSQFGDYPQDIVMSVYGHKIWSSTEE